MKCSGFTNVKSHRDFIFNTGSGDEDVYERSVQRLVRLMMDGMNGMVMTIGAFPDGRRELMDGDSRGGMLGLVARSIDGVFSQLEREAETAGGGRSGGYSGGGGAYQYFVFLSYVELYNEVLVDLLDSSNRELDIGLDESRGVMVRGATNARVKSASDAMELFQRGMANHTNAMTDYGNSAADAHSILQIDITQVRGGMDSKARSTKTSRLILADIAGTSKLAMDPSGEFVHACVCARVCVRALVDVGAWVARNCVSWNLFCARTLCFHAPF